MTSCPLPGYRSRETEIRPIERPLQFGLAADAVLTPAQGLLATESIQFDKDWLLANGRQSKSSSTSTPLKMAVWNTPIAVAAISFETDFLILFSHCRSFLARRFNWPDNALSKRSPPGTPSPVHASHPTFAS